MVSEAGVNSAHRHAIAMSGNSFHDVQVPGIWRFCPIAIAAWIKAIPTANLCSLPGKAVEGRTVRSIDMGRKHLVFDGHGQSANEMRNPYLVVPRVSLHAFSAHVDNVPIR